MSSIPDFLDTEPARNWRAAFAQVERPESISADEWELVINSSQRAAVLALETFYRVAMNSEEAWAISTTIMNGAELAKLLLNFLQDCAHSVSVKDGMKVGTAAFALGADGPERQAVQ